MKIFGKNYRATPGGRLDRFDKFTDKMNYGPWPMIIMSLFGLLMGGIFALGLNEIHPL